MIINYKWNKSIKSNKVNIESHPLNKTKLQKLEQFVNQNSNLSVIEIKNNRTVIIDAMQIESSSSCGHLSEVFTIDNQRYYLINE